VLQIIGCISLPPSFSLSPLPLFLTLRDSSHLTTPPARTPHSHIPHPTRTPHTHHIPHTTHHPPTPAGSLTATHSRPLSRPLSAWHVRVAKLAVRSVPVAKLAVSGTLRLQLNNSDFFIVVGLDAGWSMGQVSGRVGENQIGDDRNTVWSEPRGECKYEVEFETNRVPGLIRSVLQISSCNAFLRQVLEHLLNSSLCLSA
jgi:hypothetical protein